MDDKFTGKRKDCSGVRKDPGADCWYKLPERFPVG